MQATPVRAPLGSALEWLIAAMFLLATVAVATLIVRELRSAPPRGRAARGPGGHSPDRRADPRDLGAGALLLDGKEVRVGQTINDVRASSAVRRKWDDSSPTAARSASA